MTKWVENKDVKFTCQRDIYEYLVAGNGVKHKMNRDGDVVFFDNNGNVGSWVFDYCESWTPMKRAEWYEDIPEKGVLCWVSDHPIKNYLMVVKSYEKGICYTKPQGAFSLEFNSIRPAKKEEVMQYILPD